MFSKKVVEPVVNAYVVKVRIMIDTDQFVQEFILHNDAEPTHRQIATEVMCEHSYYNKDISMFFPSNRLKSFQVLSINKVQ